MGRYSITLPITVTVNCIKLQQWSLTDTMISVSSLPQKQTGQFSARTHFLTPSLPGKSITITSASCKSQIISHTTDGLIQRAVSGCLFQHSAEWLLATPTEITLINIQTYQKVIDNQVDIYL